MIPLMLRITFILRKNPFKFPEETESFINIKQIEMNKEIIIGVVLHYYRQVYFTSEIR